MTWAGRVARPLAWLALGLLLVLVGTQESRARLQPYYVLRTATEDAAIKPRILFVLDTSGSMGTKTQPADPVTGQLAECRWDRCEDAAWMGTAEESRISAAKRAISEVITATQDDAKFALLTFLHVPGTELHAGWTEIVDLVSDATSERTIFLKASVLFRP